jgi:hypothetical protein
MSFRDWFTGLDNIPSDDRLLRATDEVLTAIAQAHLDGDRDEARRLEGVLAEWQCAVLTSWWNIA